MTLIAVASVKGSPGVTTISCLLGATWPDPNRVVVVECDPSGGDLAARFSLSSRRGWTTLAASIRRRGPGGPLAEHLQELPGGLRLLVSGRDADGASLRLAPAFTSRGPQFSDGPWDAVVDLGRVLPDGGREAAWLEIADAILLVLRADAASVLRVKERTDEDAFGSSREKIQLVTVGPGYSADEIERFVFLPVVAHLPWDTKSARLLSGQGPSRPRRLRRSTLIDSVAGLALRLANEAGSQDDARTTSGIPTVEDRDGRARTLDRSRQGHSIDPSVHDIDPGTSTAAVGDRGGVLGPVQ